MHLDQEMTLVSSCQHNLVKNSMIKRSIFTLFLFYFFSFILLGILFYWKDYRGGIFLRKYSACLNCSPFFLTYIYIYKLLSFCRVHILGTGKYSSLQHDPYVPKTFGCCWHNLCYVHCSFN